MRLRIWLATAASLGSVLLMAACFDNNDPSSFGNPPPEGGSSDGSSRPSDAAGASDSPSLVGDGGPGSFQCGQTVCSAGYYCVRNLSDAGAEESSACYPLLQCKDCPCVTNVAATTYCSGETLGCSGPPGGPLYLTCKQGSPPAQDAGGGG